MNDPDRTPGHDEAQLWMRPYASTAGRTRPTTALDLVSLVRTTGRVSPTRLASDHSQTLQHCHVATSVAEVAARLQQPVFVAKILLSDLIQLGAVTAHPPRQTVTSPDLHTLEKVLHALQRC